MTTRANPTRRTTRRPTSAERPVVYHGITIAPIAGKRSPVAKAIRDALRSQAEQASGQPARA